MNKKISLGAAIAITAIVATIVFSITMLFSKQIFNTQISNIDIRQEEFDKLNQLDRIVTNNYVNANGIVKQELLDSISAGYISGIGDPYAQYYTAEAYSTQESTYQGQRVGIGVNYRISKEGYPEITEVYSGSPAENVGLKVGDVITKVNDINTFTLPTAGVASTSEEALAQLSGEDGSKVKITYRRTNAETASAEEKDVEATLSKVEIPTVYSKMLSNGNGLIRITNFYDNTPTQFEEAIKSLQSQGATGIIFDVRDNSGGTMDSVVAVLNTLVENGTLLTIRYNDGTEDIQTTSDTNSVDLPMVIITNKNTASSAEIFTQDLKDLGKAKSVGETTYGKGVMQQFFKLNDGSAVRLTNAELFTNSNISIDGVGVTPDYSVVLTQTESDTLDAILWNDRNAQNDTQLAKAIEFLETQKNASGTGTTITSSTPEATVSTDETLVSTEEQAEPVEEVASTDETTTTVSE